MQQEGINEHQGYAALRQKYLVLSLVVRDLKRKHDTKLLEKNDVRGKTIAPTITSMRESGSTWDQIAKQSDAMSVPTARGGKWYGKTVLNAANKL